MTHGREPDPYHNCDRCGHDVPQDELWTHQCGTGATVKGCAWLLLRTIAGFALAFLAAAAWMASK
jgi:hypothetical protein